MVFWGYHQNLEEYTAYNFGIRAFYSTCEKKEMHQFQAKDTKGEDNIKDWEEDEKIILKWQLKENLLISRTWFTGFSSESTSGS